ncbi:MAG: LacI family DNA-binding transcriptional regulator [Propionibacterium sp.]|nr:LacI family DNA-binding transcriptional regulator [Propionibacterium sp.]
MPKRISIVDVAREAGVAISSVSAALNGGPGVSEATRARVRETADRMGWVPSVRGRSLSSKRTRALGLVVQRQPGVLEADPFFAGFIGGVESVLESAGYALLLQIGRSAAAGADRLRRLALSGAVDGVFLTDVSVEDPRYALLDHLQLPAVAVNAPGSVWVSSVTQDHRSGLSALMEHLIALGHRDIAHVAGTPGLVHSEERESVWRCVLESHGLPLGPVITGDFTTEAGARAADALLGGSRVPTAVVCANDLMAIGFLSRAKALGVGVPDDVSVTGFDGVLLGAHVHPPLTTVMTLPGALGTRAAEVLLASVDGGPRVDETIAPAVVVDRASVAPPRVRMA